MKTKFIPDGYMGEMPAAFCPSCFKLLNGVTNMEGQEKPKPGDCTVCMGCASVLRFTEDMQLEMSSLMEIPVEYRFNFAKMVAAVKQIAGIR
jgi:hypothetical protein